MNQGFKGLKGTTEKTEKNGKTEKKVSFHLIILKNLATPS